MIPLKRAFVTGSTGLLGNNLVRMLVERGVEVRALARSRAKATKQFEGLGIEIVEGDMANVPAFAGSLAGVDVLFHTAAFWRDSYKGGKHWDELYAINVEGTKRLLEVAYAAGVRRMVHTSSIAVLAGAPGKPIDETMLRSEAKADDYYRSKILSDRVVLDFLARYADMNASLILPGFMYGPGDIGPTAAGQMVLDFLSRKLPGVPSGSYSVVDARDVAACQIAAAERGRSGERYLAAGRHMTVREIFASLEHVSGTPAPARSLPLPLVFLVASLNEAYSRLTKRPILFGMDAAKLLVAEADRSHFLHEKSAQELGLQFRPFDETLRDVIDWYQANAYLPARVAG